MTRAGPFSGGSPGRYPGLVPDNHCASSHISLKFGAGRTIRCVRSCVLRE
jgi:hypothetical protein